MELTDAQKSALAEWADAGADLGDIQKRLKDEFEINLTYLDTRFLLGDLGIELRSEQEEEEQPDEQPDEDADSEDPAAGGEEGDAEESGSGVSVTVDTVAQPHAVVSGRVTFSDGESAAWYLDAMGRLGLDPSKEGYKPSETDIAVFQVELQNVLRKSGF